MRIDGKLGDGLTSARAERVTGLPALLESLTSAVATLGAVGANGACDVRLYASGCRDGRRTSDLRLEDGRIQVAPACDATPFPAAGPDDRADRLAILLADFCFVGWTWGWDLDRLADVAGCSERMLCQWLDLAGTGAGVELPPAAERGIRRALVVDHHRRLADVADADAPGWMARPRAELDGLSIAVAIARGGQCFDDAVRLLCGAEVPSVATVH